MAEDKDRGPTNGSHPDGDDPTSDPTDDATTNGSSSDGVSDGTEPTDEELAAAATDADPDEPGPDENGDGELVSVGAPTRSASRSAGNGTSETKARSAGVARPKKDKATPKQQQVAQKPKRTTPAQFVRESVGELRKVVYPTGSQLANYFVVVLVFVLFIIAIVSLLDLGLGALILKIFA